MSTGTRGRLIRRAGFLLVVASLLLTLAYGIFIITGLRRELPLYVSDIFSGLISGGSVLGFGCIAGGGAMARKSLQQHEPINPANNPTDGKARAKPQVEEEYQAPRETHPGFRKKLTATVVGSWASHILFLVARVHQWATAFYYLALGFTLILVAVMLAEAVGHLNEDVWRVYIAGYHVHESFMGMAYILSAVPLMLTGWGFADQYIGLFYFLAGTFLIGRDWRDVARGEVLVKDRGDLRDESREEDSGEE